MSDFGSGHDLAVCGFEPCVGLCADSSEPKPDSDSVCVYVCVCFNVYLFLRKRETVQVGEGQRETHRI